MRLRCRLSFPLLIVGTFLCEIVVCAVELHPEGYEFICPSPSVQVSRTLTCNVSGTFLIWSISTTGDSITTHTFADLPSSSNVPYDIKGIVATLILKSSNILSSELVIPDNRNLLPITIQCKESGSGAVPLEYSLKSKEIPDPPGNITVSRTSEMDGNYSLQWQPPASATSRVKPVDSYILTITPISSPSTPQTFITNDTFLSAYFDYSTNYTVSLKASNCAGNSSDLEYEITRDAIQPAVEASTTTTTTASTMPSGSSEPAGVSPPGTSSVDAISPETSGSKSLTTAASTVLVNKSPLQIGGGLLTLIAAIAAAIVLLIILIIVVIGTLLCYRRRSGLKSVSMETASRPMDQSNNAIDENGVYSKLKAFETPELTKHFHNPQYAELARSSTSSEKGDPFSPDSEHIYHVLEGPAPTTRVDQDQLYAEVGMPSPSGNSCPEKWQPDKNSTTPEDVKVKPQVSAHPATQLRYQQPPSKDTRTWNYSYH